MFPSLTMRAHAEAVRPCFLRKRPHGKDDYKSHCWIRSIVLVFRIERMTGFEPRFPAWEAGVLPLHHIRMAVLFRIRRTAVTCCPPAERGMAGFRVTSGACTPDGAWMPAFANALRPFLPVVTDVLIPPAGAAGRTARASSRPGEIHGKRYSHASRIDRIRTCDPMLPKHVRYQTAPQSDIFDRTPWLTSYVRALLNAISSDSGTVLSSTTMLSS